MTTTTIQNILEKQVDKFKDKYPDNYHCELFLRQAIKESITEAFESTRVKEHSHDKVSVNKNHEKDELWACIDCYEDRWFNAALTEQREKQELFLMK